MSSLAVASEVETLEAKVAEQAAEIERLVHNLEILSNVDTMGSEHGSFGYGWNQAVQMYRDVINYKILGRKQ